MSIPANNTTRRIMINTDLEIVVARMQAREVARELGFGTIDQARISLAAGELARQLSKTGASRGEVHISEVTNGEQSGIQVVGVNPASGKQGLSASIKSLVDEYDIEADGSRITLIKWLA